METCGNEKLQKVAKSCKSCKKLQRLQKQLFWKIVATFVGDFPICSLHFWRQKSLKKSQYVLSLLMVVRMMYIF